MGRAGPGYLSPTVQREAIQRWAGYRQVQISAWHERGWRKSISVSAAPKRRWLHRSDRCARDQTQRARRDHRRADARFAACRYGRET